MSTTLRRIRPHRGTMARVAGVAAAGVLGVFLGAAIVAQGAAPESLVATAVAEPTTTAGATAPDATAPPIGPIEPPAAPEVDPEIEADPVGAIGRLVGAIKAGQWRLAIAIGIALLMLVLQRVRHRVKWFAGDRGGAILVGVLSLGTALSGALLSEAALDLELLLGAVGVMWTAVGGYTWVRRLIWPKDSGDTAAGEIVQPSGAVPGSDG